MCTFGVGESIALAGVVASLAAAGTSYVASQQQIAAQKKAQEQYQNDQAAAMEMARQKQNRIEQERESTMQTTYKNYDPETQKQQQSDIAGELNDKYSAGLDNLVPGATLPGGDQSNPDSVGGKAVGDSYKKSLTGLGSYLKQQASTRASLDAFGNQLANNSIFNTHQGQQLAMFNNFMGGNNTTDQTAMQAANLNYAQNSENAKTAGAGLATGSAIAGGLGSALTSYGGSKARAGGGYYDGYTNVNGTPTGYRKATLA